MKNLFFLLLLLIGCSASAQKTRNVSAEEFKKEIEAGKSVLIDLRTDEEIKTKGKIKGSMQIDFLGKDAETKIEKLDKNKTYLLYCAGGGRSADCAELMKKLGFKETVNLEKGFSGWKNKGYAIEQVGK